MSQPQSENVYLPKIAIMDRVVEEIADVKTFYWHFEDPAEQTAFRKFLPGQFAQVSVFGAGEFPASLPPSPTEDELFFTVRRVGSVTAALHQLQPGDKFAVRGPYGNGFPMTKYFGRNLLFVAGGIGLIPLRSCLNYALDNRHRYGKIQLFYGARGSEGSHVSGGAPRVGDDPRLRVLSHRGSGRRPVDRPRRWWAACSASPASRSPSRTPPPSCAVPPSCSGS